MDALHPTEVTSPNKVFSAKLLQVMAGSSYRSHHFNKDSCGQIWQKSMESFWQMLETTRKSVNWFVVQAGRKKFFFSYGRFVIVTWMPIKGKRQDI